MSYFDLGHKEYASSILTKGYWGIEEILMLFFFVSQGDFAGKMVEGT